MNDAELLRNFIEAGSETAFQTLVGRHLPLVFGTARRLTGDPALAEEVAQAVFLLLARKAPGLRREVILSGWLYRTTRFVAMRALAAEQRRRRREQEAVTMLQHTDTPAHWQQLSPILDDALARLRDGDRQAVLLRFFEKRSFRDVGHALGLSEEAAKKRVARAIDKLRDLMRWRGREVTAAALAAGLELEGVAAVPMAVADRVTQGVMVQLAATGSTGTPLLDDVLQAWRMARMKAGLAAGAGLVLAVLLLPPWSSPRDDLGVESRSSPEGVGTNARSKQVQALPSHQLPGAGRIGDQAVPLRTLSITVLDGETDAPVAGARVWLTRPVWVNGAETHDPLYTGGDGRVAFAIPQSVPGDEEMQFIAHVRPERHAPRAIQWLSTTGNVYRIMTNDYTLRVHKGVTLAGVVVDEQGWPLPAARIGVSSYGSLGHNALLAQFAVREFPYYARTTDLFDPLTLFTDFHGRFQIPDFSAELDRLVLEVVANDGAGWKTEARKPGKVFPDEPNLPQIPFADLESGAARIVVPLGVTLRGVVEDASGKPIPGAEVKEMRNTGGLKTESRLRTDRFGRFIFENRKYREVILVASADGHATASRLVTAGREMDEVRLQLPTERPLSVQLVNESREPWSDRSVVLLSHLHDSLGIDWHGRTDGEGRFEWRSAPTNELAFGVQLGDWHSIVRLQSTGQEQVGVMRSNSLDSVRITGRVMDVRTGAPIQRFHYRLFSMMIAGKPSLSQFDMQGEGSGGAFDVRLAKAQLRERQDGHVRWAVLVDADGYESSFTRRHEFEEGDQQVELRLHPVNLLTGRVSTPDGAPAAKADLTISLRTDPFVQLKPGDPTLDSLAGTRADGTFRMKKPAMARELLIEHATGWAVVPLERDQREADVALQPWSRVEGVVADQRLAKKGARAGLSGLIRERTGVNRLPESTRIDEQGRFAFDRVRPGDYTVGLLAPQWHSPVVGSLYHAVRVQVRPAETSRVVLASTGATVVVKLDASQLQAAPATSNLVALLHRDVVLPLEPARTDYASDMSHAAALHRYVRDPVVLAALGEQITFPGTLTGTGEVVFEHVPAGRYRLEIKVLSREPVEAGKLTLLGTELAAVRSMVTIPSGVPDKQASGIVSLGEFTLEPR
jgi:RNA polymerase sigma factor (sigma-70 family)